MIDFERARAHMVDNQLRTSGITDRRILSRMGAVARETFVPEARRPVAYIDDVQWLGAAAGRRFLLAPATFGKLLQLAEISEADTVLDIGAASGYSTAVIAGLAASVTGYEIDADLAGQARTHLAALGLANATIVSQLGNQQFDVVFVEGALETVPEDFLSALKDGGRLVAVMQSGGVAVATVIVKSGRGVASRSEFNVTVPPLFAAKREQEFVF